MTIMKVDRFTIDTGPTEDTLKATMNRYRPLGLGLGVKQRRPQDKGYILLFAHAIGFHKEHWEPTIERLFKNDKGNESATRILEAWAIDYQNHGEAAALNDETLMRKPNIFTLRHYAEAFVNLYQSGLLGELQKGNQKVVIVGHSGGANALIFATALLGSPSATPFDTFILVEPSLFAKSTYTNVEKHTTEHYRLIEKSMPFRRSIWEDREAAFEWMKKRVPYKSWDRRILKLYTEHGLRQLPTPFHPNRKGVVLSCDPKSQEAPLFSNHSIIMGAFEHFHDMCRVTPVHLVFGSKSDMFSREVQDMIPDPSVGRVVASVTRIQGSGHLVVQEQPDEVANVIYSILNTKRVGAPKL